MRDQAEQRMSKKQEKERQEAGEQNKKRYEQAFARALKIAYPLLPPEKERLRKMQQTFGLTDTEVSRLEKPHLDEAKRLNIPNPPERRREPTIQHPPEPSGSGVPANYLIPSVVLTVLS